MFNQFDLHLSVISIHIWTNNENKMLLKSKYDKDSFDIILSDNDHNVNLLVILINHQIITDFAHPFLHPISSGYSKLISLFFHFIMLSVFQLRISVVFSSPPYLLLIIRICFYVSTSPPFPLIEPINMPSYTH